MSPDRTEALRTARQHCEAALGYGSVEVMHTSEFTNSTAFLLRCGDCTFGLVVERDGTIEIDDIPEHKYHTMARTGKLCYVR